MSFCFVRLKDMWELFNLIGLRPFKSSLQSYKQNTVNGFSLAIGLRVFHGREVMLDSEIFIEFLQVLVCEQSTVVRDDRRWEPY